MHFQIFVPGGQGQNPQMLIDAGLADFVAGAEYMSNQQGPSDLRGAVIAWRKPGAVGFGYQPDKQTWIPAAKLGECEPGRYWVGYWNDSSLTPQDLLRPYSHPGKSLELGDGCTWRVPRIQSLPRDLVLADDGTWKFALQRDYHDLWMESMEWIEKLIQNDTHDFTQLVDFCVRCLRQNYRLTPEVISHLKLFNTRNIQRAVASILDLELADEQ